MNELTELMNFTYNLCEDGDYESAIQYFDVVLSKDPKNTVILNDKGVTLHNLGKNKEAIQCYDQVLKIEQIRNPGLEDLYLGMKKLIQTRNKN